MATLLTSQVQDNTANSSLHSNHIVFIDTAIADYHSLVNGVIPNTKVFLIEATQNGVEQITKILAADDNLNHTTIHIVAHGVPGCLYLGNTHLGLDTLNTYQHQLLQWQKITNLLIYGCNVAVGDAGTEFIAKLHQLTKAKIAASRQRVGNAELGGNWELEVCTAKMEVTLAFTETTRQTYQGVFATFIVNDTGDSDDGNPNNSTTTLREAINLANSTAGTDTISFDGVFTDNTPDTIILTSGKLTITDDLTILGTGASLLKVSGNNASGVFEISETGTDVIIEQLTIADGNDFIYGGILINSDTTLNLNNSNVTANNSANFGGGIHNFGTLSLTNTTVSDNNAPFGAGIFNRGSLSLSNSRISGNNANSDGGGIYNNDIGILNSTDSTVSGNTANFGGGITNLGNLNLTNTTVSENTANFGGGGISNGSYRGGSATLTNSTVSGNTAKSGGGGGISTAFDITLNNTTVTNNTADYGGGVLNEDGRANLGNTIIAGNFDSSSSGDINPDVNGNFTDLGNNLIGDSTGSTGFTTSTLVGTSTNPINPQLGLLQNNGGATLTHALLTNSPAINHGNNTLIPAGITTDQRGVGFSRIINGIVDIGAYEAVASGINLNGTSGNDTLDGSNYPDTINGQAGNDSITGNQGEDTLIGGVGDDVLIGGAGNDTLTGGAGKDKFVYQNLSDRGTNGDTINDFNRRYDQLILTDLFSSLNYSGSNVIADGYLRFVQLGSATQVQIDSNGGGDEFNTLVTLNQFIATRLVLGTHVIV